MGGLGGSAEGAPGEALALGGVPIRPGVTTVRGPAGGAADAEATGGDEIGGEVTRGAGAAGAGAAGRAGGGVAA